MVTGIDNQDTFINLKTTVAAAGSYACGDYVRLRFLPEGFVATIVEAGIKSRRAQSLLEVLICKIEEYKTWEGSRD